MVEDDRAVQTRMRLVLEKRGYDVLVASDGSEALDLLQSHIDIQFVLSDWVMPTLDGVGLCRVVKSSDFGRYLFFVLLSSQDDHDSITQGINAGADDFVAKNTPVDELEARIRAGFRTLSLHNELVEKNTALNQAYTQLQQDLLSARELMCQLLPVRTQYTNTELTYAYQPTTEIGGDMLGCIELDRDHIAFYILDVSGHGVPSALLSFSVHQTLNGVDSDNAVVYRRQDNEHRRIRPSHEVLATLNDIYCQNDANAMYFSMVYAVLNTRSGKLDIAFAGHPPMVWCQSGKQQLELFGDSGYVVGMFDFATYESTQIQLAQGDECWLYTDGVTEARVESELFGELKLCETLNELKRQPFAQRADKVIEQVKQWQQGAHLEDDVSLLGVRWGSHFQTQETGTMTLLSGEKYQKQFVTSLSMARAISEELKVFWEAQSIEDSVVSDLELCVVELANNVYEHAYSEKEGQPVTVSCWIDHRSVIIKVANKGEALEAAELEALLEQDLPALDLDNPIAWATSGRGFYILNALLDSVSVEQIDGMNVFTLIKHL
ncbi:ATP-binding SpoIIE family protein phosphatase [Vibrio parahaemolyticus]